MEFIGGTSQAEQQKMRKEEKPELVSFGEITPIPKESIGGNEDIVSWFSTTISSWPQKIKSIWISDTPKGKTDSMVSKCSPAKFEGLFEREIHVQEVQQSIAAGRDPGQRIFDFLNSYILSRDVCADPNSPKVRG